MITKKPIWPPPERRSLSPAPGAKRNPPDNAVNFWSWLSADTAPRLEKLEFAVLGLGDKNYSEFCGASKKFDSRLEALGAHRLLPRGECDVDYEAPAKAWTESLWQKLAAPGSSEASPASVTSDRPVGSAMNGSPGGQHALDGSGWSKASPFPARLLASQLLNQPGSAKEVYHHQISLEGSGLVYEPGDALGVVPKNCPEFVNTLLAALNCTGDEPVKTSEATLQLREAYTCHYDILKPTAQVLPGMRKGRARP